MWMSKEAYYHMRDAGIKDAAINAALQSHNVALQTSLDWMRVRLTQLEHERAHLIKTYLGITLPVPVIEEAPTGLGQGFEDSITLFSDVGDAEAERMGIGWADDGTTFTR